MSIQGPEPELRRVPKLVAAGLNDWGGVSPVTPDHVNPEAPGRTSRTSAADRGGGKVLTERLAIYPAYALERERWLDEPLRTPTIRAIDADGFARVEEWSPGDADHTIPAEFIPRTPGRGTRTEGVATILDRAAAGDELGEAELVRLFQARGDDYHAICAAADDLRRRVNAETVTYVVNRNINYTNICYFRCQFCAFAKGKMSESLRGTPYDLGLEEVVRRVREAWDRGATEVCMQGGIHPEYTGAKYLDILRAVKEALPAMHVMRSRRSKSRARRRWDLGPGVPPAAQASASAPARDCS
jgi:FO synthase